MADFDCCYLSKVEICSETLEEKREIMGIILLRGNIWEAWDSIWSPYYCGLQETIENERKKPNVWEHASFNFNTNIYFTNFIVRMIMSECLRIVSIALLPLFHRASCASVKSRTSVQKHQMISDTNLIMDSFYAMFHCLIVFQNSESFFFFPGFICWDRFSMQS